MAKGTRVQRTRQTASATVNNKELVLIDVKAFMNKFGYVTVHNEVRENKNGYPFITFINAKNEAENIYFSKQASEQVEAGDEIAKGFFDDFMATETTNAAGEIRWKICSMGDSTRVSVDDLF